MFIFRWFSLILIVLAVMLLGADLVGTLEKHILVVRSLQEWPGGTCAVTGVRPRNADSSGAGAGLVEMPMSASLCSSVSKTLFGSSWMASRSAGPAVSPPAMNGASRYATVAGEPTQVIDPPGPVEYTSVDLRTAGHRLRARQAHRDPPGLHPADPSARAPAGCGPAATRSPGW